MVIDIIHENEVKYHQFSMPVGRIEYIHFGPMTFEEFLLAMGKRKLLDFLQSYCLPESIPDPNRK